jgi:hypothetical protein
MLMPKMDGTAFGVTGKDVLALGRGDRVCRLRGRGVELRERLGLQLLGAGLGRPCGLGLVRGRDLGVAQCDAREAW